MRPGPPMQEFCLSTPAYSRESTGSLSSVSTPNSFGPREYQVEHRRLDCAALNTWW